MAKRNAKKVIVKAKGVRGRRMGENVENEDGKGRVFKMLKQMKAKNKDVTGGGSIRDSSGLILVAEEKINKRWRSHFEKLSNEEFDWKRDDLDNDNMVYGPMKEITFHEVKLALGKMKSGKAMGPSGVVLEILAAAGDVGVQWMVDLCNAVVREGKVPDDWSTSWIVNVYKCKGDAIDCGSYRGYQVIGVCHESL